MAQGRPLFPLLIARNRRLGFDARRVAPRGSRWCARSLTNVAWSLSEQALGRPSPTPALVERLWDPRLGRFLDDVRGAARPPRRGRPGHVGHARAARAARPAATRSRSGSSSEVLRAPRLRGRGAAAVGRARRPGALRARDVVGPPPPLARPELGQQRVARRAGLRRLGLDAEADAMAQRLAAVVEREGFREYYEARSGAGMGARDFGWSTLIVEMLDPTVP